MLPHNSHKKICLFVFFFLATLNSMRDLNSPARNGTMLPAVRTTESQNWATREVCMHFISLMVSYRLPKWPNGKESSSQCRRHGFDPWLGRSPGEGNGNPPQHSCLENSMGRGAWRATVHGVAELDMTEHAHYITVQKCKVTQLKSSRACFKFLSAWLNGQRHSPSSCILCLSAEAHPL